jgi:hypothetical protein
VRNQIEYNADVGVYSAPWHDENGDGVNEYWGVFASIGDVQGIGPRWVDYSNLASPPWDRPGDRNPNFLVWFFPGQEVKMFLRVQGPIVYYTGTSCHGYVGSCKMYYSPNNNQGYLVQTLVGNNKWRSSCYPNQYCQGKRFSSYSFLYPVENLYFKGDGNCNVGVYFDFYGNDTGTCFRISTPSGWKIYRSTTILASDSAETKGNIWKDTRLTKTSSLVYDVNPLTAPPLYPATADVEYLDTLNTRAIKQNFAETPNLTCGLLGALVSDPLLGSVYKSSYNKDYTYIPTGNSDLDALYTGKMWNSNVLCKSTHYRTEAIDITVTQK